MATEIKQTDENTVGVHIEVDCPCEVGICEHAMEQVKNALQQAYTKGVRDGATGALDNVRSYLKRHFPGEFDKAEKSISNQRAN
jgi:hypothetical protein